MVMFCTDDCHPDDFVRGHINLIVKRALADGYDLWDVLQAASVNAQKHYNQNWGLLQAGDPVHVIHASDGSLLTDHEEVVLTGNPLFDSRYPWTEVQKIVVYNRYVPGAKPVVGLVRGFDLKDGAIARSVAHDCHNIVATMYSERVPMRNMPPQMPRPLLT